MSIAAEVVRVISKSGQKIPATKIYDDGSFDCETVNVYAALQTLSQRQGVLDRERIEGVYHYSIKPGVDVSKYLKGQAEIPDTISASHGGSQNGTMAKIIRASAGDRIDGSKINGHVASSNESATAQPSVQAVTSKNVAVAAPVGETQTAATAVPLPAPGNAGTKELAIVLSDLRQRRDSLNAAITVLENLMKEAA